MVAIGALLLGSVGCGAPGNNRIVYDRDGVSIAADPGADFAGQFAELPLRTARLRKMPRIPVAAFGNRRGELVIEVRSEADQPVAQVKVDVDSQLYGQSKFTDMRGEARFRVLPGTYFMTFYFGPAVVRTPAIGVERAKRSTLHLIVGLSQ